MTKGKMNIFDEPIHMEAKPVKLTENMALAFCVDNDLKYCSHTSCGDIWARPVGWIATHPKRYTLKVEGIIDND